MKVTRKPANFSTSGEYNTAGVTIDESLAQNYNSRIVNTAIELKAKYGSKYSDEYYLESAANWYKSELNTAFNSAYLKGTVGCPIQNPQWAGYSYEEIIQMENNGVKIPQDVLLWAHAQQESDITSYEVVTSTGENDDNSSTEELSGDFDINSLQKKAKENIAKSEKAQEDIQQTVEEYNQNKEKAIQLKNEKEKALKNSISEITKLTNEWKKLDQKAKSGTLSEAERSRYEELSKTLGNETNKNTSFDNNELDELLKSMNLLETKATEDLVIADETVQSGRELSKYNKNYHQMQQTHILNNMILSGDSGLLSNTIFGSSSTYIQELAIRTGNDLSILSNAQLTELNTPETVDLKDFATAYTDINKNTNKENNNQSTQTTNQDENKVAPQSQNTQTTNATNSPATNDTNNLNSSTKNLNNNTNKKEKEDKNINYFVFPMSGSPAAALAATAVSAISTADLIGKQDKTNETKVKLQKDLAATEKNLQRLQKQINNVEKQHNDYIQTSETYLAQIDNLMAEQEAPSVQNNNPQPKPIVLNQNPNSNNVNPQTENNDTTPEIEEQEEQQQPQNPKFEQIQNISNELNTVAALDNALISSMKKNITIGQNLINSNQKTTKTLNQQKNNLNERNQNNQLVSISTTYCGTLTTTMGAYNMSIAIPMLNTGLSMLASLNPVTVSMGQAMCAVARQWIAIATAQLVTGPGALTAGTVGIVASIEASKDIKEQGNLIKNSQKESDANNKTLRALNNNLNKLEPIQGVNAADFAPSQPAQQPQDTPKLATSKTREISFETMKDVTKLPQGPTNLSNPLNDVKNTPQSAKTTPTQTPKTEEKKPQEDVKTQTTPSNTNAKTNSTPATSTPIAEVTDSTPATSSTPTTEVTNSTQTTSTTTTEDTLSTQTTAETYSTPEAQAIPINTSTAQTQEPKTTPTSETTTTETETSTNSTQNTEEPAPVDETTTATTDETSTPEATSTEENDTPEEDEIIDTDNIEKETELEIAMIENNTQSGEFTDDATLLGAAATTSANIKSNVTTDDKADRKLSRFNMDSIIESKKKKKKVQAVSASSKG